MPLTDLSKTATQILVGGTEFFVSDYVANAGAGTFSSLGHLAKPSEFGFGFEDFDVESELSIGRVKTVPVNADYTIKTDLLQNNPEAMRVAARLGTGQISGAVGAQILAFSDPIEVYYQIKGVAPGFGSTKTDTYLWWKAQVATVDPVAFAKKGVQQLTITWKVLRDDSVASPTTNGLYGKRTST